MSARANLWCQQGSETSEGRALPAQGRAAGRAFLSFFFPHKYTCPFFPPTSLMIRFHVYLQITFSFSIYTDRPVGIDPVTLLLSLKCQQHRSTSRLEKHHSFPMWMYRNKDPSHGGVTDPALDTPGPPV